MKFKITVITIFLITGFSFLRCVEDDCGDFTTLEYFNIQDIQLLNFTYNNVDGLVEIENEFVQVPTTKNILFFLDYLVEYHAQNELYFQPFSITNTAYGCTPVENGHSGSKDEMITNLSIITLNDFDDNHLKNDTINDLFRVPYHEYFDVSVGTGEGLNTFLSQNTTPIEQEDLYLELLQAPTLNDTFQVKIIMELSTNEVYEMESLPVVFYD